MSTWLARLKNQNPPGTGATKPTKPTQDTPRGGFVGFVAHPQGHIQKIDGTVVNPETPAANAPAIDPDRWCWPDGLAMNTAEIDTFTARLARFTDKGLTLAVAESLADGLVQRDREMDDRHAKSPQRPTYCTCWPPCPAAMNGCFPVRQAPAGA